MNNDFRALVDRYVSRGVDCICLRIVDARQAAIAFASHSPFTVHRYNVLVLSHNASMVLLDWKRQPGRSRLDAKTLRPNIGAGRNVAILIEEEIVCQ
jgi:hypothetical protein